MRIGKSIKRSAFRISARLWLAPLLLAAALALMPALAVRADDYTVTNTDASGPGSLRQAILDANSNPGPDAISFGPGVSGTIVLTAALPAIGDDLTITGPGAESLAISGDDAYRVFEIDASTAVSITNVTVRDGYATNGDGGGIYSAGDLFLGNTRVISNFAGWSGGGMFVEQGTATLSNTRVISNSAYFFSCLILGQGGGVYVSGTATLNVSGGEISRNSAGWSGGGVYVEDGTATLTGTRVLGNFAPVGSGLYLNNSGTITASNGCVVNNSGIAVYNTSAGSSTLVAADNWWGTASGPGGAGPGVGDSVSAGVDFVPFKTTPPPGCPIIAVTYIYLPLVVRDS